MTIKAAKFFRQGKTLRSTPRSEA